MEIPKIVPRPWTPVVANETEKGCKFNVWGREYSLEDSVLFSSIITQGKEILAGPMRIVSRENGEESKWRDAQVFLMDENTDDCATAVATMTSDSFYINTALKVEYDGCVKVDVKVMPRGITVKEVYFGSEREKEYNLDSLWLEIPVKKEYAQLYQMHPNIPLILDGGEIVKQTHLCGGNYLFEGTARANELIEQITFMNDEVGIGCFVEEKKNWQPIDENSYFEMVNGEDEAVIRVRFLDSHPKSWVHTTVKADCDKFQPLCFSVGLMVLPCKEFPKNPYEEKAVHIDCFKKVPNNYEEYLFEPFVCDDGTVTDEIVFDRLKRLGVNTLYIHEKWNDMQNSFTLTRKSAKRLKYIVEEGHKRGMAVIPYFGFEISSLRPDYNEYADKVAVRMVDGSKRSSWNRVPYQRDASVCYATEWQDMLAEGIDKLMSEYHFDGLYLDGMFTSSPRGCADEAHGCGYRDVNGVLHGTYDVWQRRNLAKKIYNIVEKYGGKINFHTAGAYQLSTLSFCHSIWDGEGISFMLIKGLFDRMPDGFFRTQYAGRIYGIPTFFVCYLNEPIWTFEHALTFSLLVGALHKLIDLDKPLEIFSKLWECLDKFPIANAKWYMLDNNQMIDISDDRIKCSYYEYIDLFGKKHLLVFFGNTSKTELKDVKISVKGNAVCKELVYCDEKSLGGEFTLDFNGFGHHIFAIDID